MIIQFLLTKRRILPEKHQHVDLLLQLLQEASPGNERRKLLVENLWKLWSKFRMNQVKKNLWKNKLDLAIELYDRAGQMIWRKRSKCKLDPEVEPVGQASNIRVKLGSPQGEDVILLLERSLWYLRMKVNMKK